MTREEQLLGTVPLFAGAPADVLARLVDRSVTRLVPAGEVVALRGDRSAHLIVVESGALTAVRDTRDGRRMRLGHYAAPCAVDKAAVLDGNGYTATWVAARRSRLRMVPAAEVHAAVDDVPKVRRHLLAHLASELRHRQDALVRTGLADTATRTAAWLVEAAGAGGTRIELPGAQQGLAESIGVTRVSVNRALATLAEEGLIRVERSAVVVEAPELLAHRATRSD